MTTRLNEQARIFLLVYLASLLVVAIAYFIYQEKQQGKLSRASIKEAVDTLPMAVCYFLPSGIVKLCNKQMEILFRFFANTDLQCYSEFLKELRACNENTVVKRLEDESDTYLFPDKTAWHYSEKLIQTKDKKTIGRYFL